MLRILSSLLLVMAIGGGLHTNSVRAEETSKLSNTARITAYWQAMLPNTPMPSAILNLLNRPDGTNDRVTKHDTANIRAAEKGTIEENSSAPFLKSRKMRSHAEESQIPGEDQKIDDQKFLFYGQSVKNKDKKVLHRYVPTEKSEDQKFLFYGQAEKTVKNNDQKFLFYGKADEKDDQKFLFYGKENDHETTKSNLKGDHHATATKNDDQNFLFYGQREKNPGSAVKNDDQKFLFYGREERNHEPTTKNDDQKFLFYGHAEKNEGRITKPNVQGDSHEGGGGHIHGSTMNNEQKFLFYGQPEKNKGPIVKNDDQKFLFYGQAEKNHGPTTKNNEQNFLFYGHVGKNEGDDNEGESGHIHGGTTTAKNGDQNFLFYGQTEKNHGSIVKNDDQKFLFYGQEEKNHGPTTKTDDQKFLFYGHAENDEEITKPNVQDDGHKGETGHTHGRTTTAKNSDENFLFYGQTEKNHGSNVKNDDQKFLCYGQAEKNHGATLKNDDQKFLFYGATDKNDGEITKPNMQGDDDVATPIAKNDDQNFLFYGQTKKNHGSTMKKDDQKFLFYGQAKKNHGSTVKNDDQQFLFYGQADKNDGELTKSNVRGHGHGVEGGHMHAGTTTVKNDDQTFLFYGEKEKTHGSTMKNDDQKFLFYGQTENKHGLTTKNNDQNFLFYGHADKNHGHGHEGEGGDIHGGTTTAKNDDQKFLFYGETEKNHGLTAKNDDEKFLFYGHAKKNDGPPVKNDDQKFLFYGQTEKNDYMITKSNMKGDGHEGKGGHVHGGLMFVEDSLKAGSTITPYIQPSFTLGASLLPRHVADSIPISTRNFTDIMTMFAPASYAMADAIWSTLDLCEHPPRVKGERDACVVSLESMVEFASSVLGTTHGLRALSSPDVPADGVMAGKRYKVKELRRVTEAGDSVTCHGLRFPVAMFICHAVNPTRLYSVTLEREHDGGAGVGGPERMEALVVCHLDTSDFNPMKMPEHVKPGDAPLCHFIARDNVLWAPSAAAAAA